jgi:hypothetical protein
MSEAPDLARKRVLADVQSGRLIPAAAAALAKEKGFEPFETEPDPHMGSFGSKAYLFGHVSNSEGSFGIRGPSPIA